MFTPQRSWIQTGVMSSAPGQTKEEEELNALKRGKVQERPQENTKRAWDWIVQRQKRKCTEVDIVKLREGPSLNSRILGPEAALAWKLCPGSCSHPSRSGAAQEGLWQHPVQGAWDLTRPKMTLPSNVWEKEGNHKECSVVFGNRLLGRLAWRGKDKVTFKSGLWLTNLVQTTGATEQAAYSLQLPTFISAEGSPRICFHL